MPSNPPWTHTAQTKPGTQALATKIGLEIPLRTMHEPRMGLIYPLRRLIVSVKGPQVYLVRYPLA